MCKYEIRLNNADSYFLCGFDDAGCKLDAVKHIGMVCDSVLIGHFPDYKVRWFIHKDEIEFYKTYLFPDRVIFYNDGTHSIKIDKFGVLNPGERMEVVMENNRDI